MSIIGDLARFVQLSQGAYARFTTFGDGAVQAALVDPSGSFAARQAQDFTDTYRILDHMANDGYGFSALLIQNKPTNEITLALRGTEPGTPDLNGLDLSTADADIFLHGLARHQIVALYNYYNRLTAPAGGTAEQYLPAPGVPNTADEVFLYEKQMVPGVGLGKLN